VLLGAGNEPHGVIATQFATSLKSASLLFWHSLSQGPGPSRSEILMCSCTFYDYHAGIPKVPRPTDPKKTQKCIHDIQECFELLALLKVNSLILFTAHYTIGYPVYYEFGSPSEIVLHPFRRT
jgi:hypothetical protein